MGVFVDFESGIFEIRYFVDKSPVLCTQSSMFEHGHVHDTGVYESAASLVFADRSPVRGSKNIAPPPPRTNGDKVLNAGSFTIDACRSVDIHGKDRRSAA